MSEPRFLSRCALLAALLLLAACGADAPPSPTPPAASGATAPVEPAGSKLLRRLKKALADRDAKLLVHCEGPGAAGQRAWLDKRRFRLLDTGTSWKSWLEGAGEHALAVVPESAKDAGESDPRLILGAAGQPERALAELGRRLADGERPREVLLVLPSAAAVQERLQSIACVEMLVALREDIWFVHEWPDVQPHVIRGVATLEPGPETTALTAGASPFTLRIESPEHAKTRFTIQLRSATAEPTFSFGLHCGGPFPTTLPPVLLSLEAGRWTRVDLPMPGATGSPVELTFDGLAEGAALELRGWGHCSLTQPSSSTLVPFQPRAHRAPGEEKTLPLMPLKIREYDCWVLPLAPDAPRILEPAPPAGGQLVLIAAAQAEGAKTEFEVPLLFEFSLVAGGREQLLARTEIRANSGKNRYRQRSMGLPATLPPDARLQVRMRAPHGIPEGLVGGFAFLH